MGKKNRPKWYHDTRCRFGFDCSVARCYELATRIEFTRIDSLSIAPTYRALCEKHWPPK